MDLEFLQEKNKIKIVHGSGAPESPITDGSSAWMDRMQLHPVLGMVLL